MNNKIPFRNRNQTGWWIAKYLIILKKPKKSRTATRKCFLWGNTIIIAANNRDVAYKKAVKFGKSDQTWCSYMGKKVRWEYIGLTMLMPIYDKISDGAEIMWEEHKNMPLKKAKSWVRSKMQLECFID